VLPDIDKEQSQHIIYKGHYDAGRYTRLTDDDLWTQLDHQCFGKSITSPIKSIKFKTP